MTEQGLRLLGVHAHPDDETITMGGTLACLSDRGVTTAILCCTDGALATIFAADMPEEEFRPKLPAVRQQELRAACSLLGVSEVDFLEYGDSGMWGEPTNHSETAFWRSDIDEVVGRMVAHIRRFRPHVVITYDGFGGYGHPDHIQTHRACLLAVEASHTSLYPDAGAPWRVEKLYYSTFPRAEARRIAEMARAAGRELPWGDLDIDSSPMLSDEDWVTTRVECAAGVLRKRAAMRAHRSQVGEEFPLLAIPEDVAISLFNHEFFHLATSRVAVSLPELDVMAGIGDN